jgi:hypothetical protein
MDCRHSLLTLARKFLLSKTFFCKIMKSACAFCVKIKTNLLRFRIQFHGFCQSPNMIWIRCNHTNEQLSVVIATWLWLLSIRIDAGQLSNDRRSSEILYRPLFSLCSRLFESSAIEIVVHCSYTTESALLRLHKPTSPCLRVHLDQLSRSRLHSRVRTSVIC